MSHPADTSPRAPASEIRVPPLKAQELSARRQAQRLIDQLAPADSSLCVLDAGCGRSMHFVFPKESRIVGIDISPTELDTHPHLDEAIVGDVQTHRFPPSSFDVVVCWDVFEHLSEPEEALVRFHEAVRPGGLVVLGLPHTRSLKARITKLTPYWAHRAVYRRLGVVDDAGDDRDPFPTYLRATLEPAKLAQIGSRHGLVPRLSIAYEGWFQGALRRRLRLEGWRWGLVQALIRAVTLGRVITDKTDCVLVFERQ
jgi:SAM-dependent methyltransferase